MKHDNCQHEEVVFSYKWLMINKDYDSFIRYGEQYVIKFAYFSILNVTSKCKNARTEYRELVGFNSFEQPFPFLATEEMIRTPIGKKFYKAIKIRRSVLWIVHKCNIYEDFYHLSVGRWEKLGSVNQNTFSRLIILCSFPEVRYSRMLTLKINDSTTLNDNMLSIKMYLERQKSIVCKQCAH